MLIHTLKKGFLLIVLGLSACGGGYKTSQADYNVSSSLASSLSSSAPSSLGNTLSSSASFNSFSSSFSSSTSTSSTFSSSEASSSAQSNSSVPAFLVVTGLVVNDSALPIEGAVVEVVGSNQQVNTLSDGSFSLELSTTIPAVLRVEKTGYSGTFRAAETADGHAAIAARIVMAKVVTTLTFSAADEAVLRVPGSAARVNMPKDSLVDPSGAAVTGEVTAQLTPIDPSKNLALMPGLMVDGVTSEPIESMGAMAVEFRDATGKRLNLGAGKTALIRIPATPGAEGVALATIPLYHLNETTGKWEQEGSAVLHTDAQTGAQYYEGTVSHFSWWNADKIMERVEINLATDANGNACSIPVGFRLATVGVNYVGGDDLPVGKGKLFARSNSQVRAVLKDSTDSLADSILFTSSAAGTVVKLSRCLTPQPKVIVSGKVNVISGDLPFHRVQVFGTNIVTKTLEIKTDGTYSLEAYGNTGDIHARLISRKINRSLVTSVSVKVGGTNLAFPDLVLEGKTVVLSGCVEGWETYRHDSATLGLFEGASSGLIHSEELTSEASVGRQFSVEVLVNQPYTIRITTPDATLAEKVSIVNVGNTSLQLDQCLKLPVPPIATLQRSGTGFNHSFDGGASQAGDAAIKSYSWDFGDGASATTASVSHNYSAAGSYIITLRVADELGQVSVAKTTLAVTNKQEFSVLTPATGLSAPASGNTVCSVQSGSPWCWGNNRTFELGRALVTTLHCESCEPIGTTMMGLQSSGLPVQVSTTLTGVTAIDVGPHHSCALVATGAVYCWGEGQYGQLGQTSRSTANIKFAEGADFSCTLGNLTENCFGGQLEGFLYRSATPLMATGINSATAISVGAYNSCALLADGTVWCWGALKSFMGILGGVTPVQVAGLSEVSSISVGSFHACAMLKSGSIRCWGNGDNGELGNGSTADSMTPVAVSGITNAASVSAGDKSTCAVLADGQVRCWGFRGVSGFATLVTGLMGDGLFGTSPATVPVLVSGITTATAVSVSGSHACAIKSDGSLWCWGFAINAMGTTQLPRVTPVQITTLPAVSAVAVGDYLTCAKLTNGQLQCLGLNTSGQLGSGGEEFLVDDVVQTTPTYSGSITPMEVIGLP